VHHRIPKLVDAFKGDSAGVVKELREAAGKRQLRLTDVPLPQLLSDLCGHRRFSEWVADEGMPLKRLEEAAGVATGAFQAIVDPFVQSTALAAYENAEFVFSKLIPKRSTVKRWEILRGLGKIGDEAIVVGEGKQYPEATLSPDWIQTPEVKKRGFVVSVTKEMMKFDETGVLSDRLTGQAESMGISNEKRACAAIVDAGESATNGYYRHVWQGTSYATYQTSTPWDNVTASTALVDFASIDTARQTFLALTDPQTGEPLNYSVKDIIVPPALAMKAVIALTNGNVQQATGGYPTTGNPTRSETPNPIYTVLGPMRLLGVNSQYFRNASGSDTTWFLGDIAGAFEYLEVEPMTVKTQGEDSESAFNADVVMRVKVSEWGTYFTKQPRKISKATA